MKQRWYSNIQWINVIAVALVAAAIVLYILSCVFHWAAVPQLPAYLIAAAAVLAYMGKE